jgi:hypothetical protein
VAPPPAGRRAGGAAAGDALLAFSNVKLLTVDASGRDTDDQDVVLNFAAGRISVFPKKGGAALQVVPYQEVSHATYVNGRKPEWDPAAPSPSDDLRVPGGFLGFGGGTRQWLTLQTKTSFVILRLDENPRPILEAVQTRTGLKVDTRPAASR